MSTFDELIAHARNVLAQCMEVTLRDAPNFHLIGLGLRETGLDNEPVATFGIAAVALSRGAIWVMTAHQYPLGDKVTLCAGTSTPPDWRHGIPFRDPTCYREALQQLQRPG